MSKCTIIEVECLRETDKAILVKSFTDFEEWIPKSQIHDDSEVWKDGDEGDLVITAWMAQQLGLDLD